MQDSCIPVLGLHWEKRRLDARGAAEGKGLGFCAGHRSSGVPQSPAVSPCCASPGPVRTQQGWHCRLMVSCSSSSSSYWSSKGAMLGWRGSSAVLEQRPASIPGVAEPPGERTEPRCSAPSLRAPLEQPRPRRGFQTPPLLGTLPRNLGWEEARRRAGKSFWGCWQSTHHGWGGEVRTSVGAPARCGKRGRTRSFCGDTQSLPCSSSSFPTPA